MYCKDIQACFAEINAYCIEKPTGRALLVNTENYDAYQEIRRQLEADSNKICVYVSDCCAEDDLPDMDEVLEKVVGGQDCVLFGYSQAGMLRSAKYIEQMMQIMLEVPVSNHTIIVLDHCEQYVKKYFSLHPDIQKRVVLLNGDVSSIPKVHLALTSQECIGQRPLVGMKHLLAYFEHITNLQVKKNPEITVVTKYSSDLFKNALISVTPIDDIYSSLCKTYSEISAGTERVNGTEKQWMFLADELSKYSNMSSVANALFGSTVNLSSYISEVIEEADENKYWLLWLCMKLFRSTSNKYLNLVMLHSSTVKDFDEHVYMDLLDISHDNLIFRQCYTERKRLLESLPENLQFIDQYCDKIGVKQGDSVYYLTNLNEKEELALMQCFETYRYSEEEIVKITDGTFPEIHDYLERFVFNITNMKVPVGEEHLRDILTNYFVDYKYQKLINHIKPDFIETVEKFAMERPYNKLQARSTLISKMERKNSQLYFFDALGVEYLGYIQERCEHYGLIAEISIGHCELPSITEKNKEFLNYFPNGVLDIKELDELKHHSQVIDYEQCKLPVHLFRELQIIDEELRKIQSRLKQGKIEKAIIVSDHGASRLAVIYEQENEKLELEEKGIHSGRCCPVKECPHIPYASYWDGFAVLANYERFKGGRKANVEVHGGASLEEVLVPIIELTKKPADIDICIVNPVVIIKGKEPASITLYSNIPLRDAKLVVNDKVYIGEFCEDNRHVKFVMPEMKRTKVYLADFYDSDKKLASDMEFHVQRNTQEQALFKNSPF